MAGDVITNTIVNIGEVLELEGKQRLVCSSILPNHMALSVPVNPNQLTLMDMG